MCWNLIDLYIHILTYTYTYTYTYLFVDYCCYYHILYTSSIKISEISRIENKNLQASWKEKSVMYKATKVSCPDYFSNL